MSITHRVSIQWADRDAYERTVTKVFSASDGQFTDVRRLKVSNDEFPYEWVSSGKAVSIPPNRQRFIKDIDSLALQAEGRGETPEIAIDEGAFEQLGNGLERETGELFNEDSNKVEPYIEIWQTEKSDCSNAVYVPKDASKFNGKLIKVDNEFQGVLERKDGKGISRLSVARAHEENGKLVVDESYGIDAEIVLDLANWVAQEL